MLLNPVSLILNSVGHCSGDEDQAQERINKLFKILKEDTITATLHDVGFKVISCIIQRDEGRAPIRHSFLWSAEENYYKEVPLLRHLEPSLSISLELVCTCDNTQQHPFLHLLCLISYANTVVVYSTQVKLKDYKNIQYTPSRDRQWHLYTVADSKAPIQRMFLRSLVRQSNLSFGSSLGQALNTEIIQAQPSLSFTSISILSSIMAALEELELHSHSAAIRSDHSHMYLCISREQQLSDLVPYSRYIYIYIYTLAVLISFSAFIS